MKKGKMLLALAFCIGIGTVIFKVAAIGSDEQIEQDGEEHAAAKAWGSYLSENAQQNSRQRKSDEIYAAGENVQITKKSFDQTVKFYELEGLPTDQAEDEAYEYIKKSESLYQEAIERGFEVTAQEVEEYVEQELKAMLSSEELGVESRAEIEGIISGFGSEEAYWEYQKSVYKKLLPAQKLVSAVEEEFYQQHPNANGDEWEEYFEQYKNELVAAENIQKLE